MQLDNIFDLVLPSMQQRTGDLVSMRSELNLLCADLVQWSIELVAQAGQPGAPDQIRALLLIQSTLQVDGVGSCGDELIATSSRHATQLDCVLEWMSKYSAKLKRIRADEKLLRHALTTLQDRAARQGQGGSHDGVRVTEMATATREGPGGQVRFARGKSAATPPASATRTNPDE